MSHCALLKCAKTLFCKKKVICTSIYAQCVNFIRPSYMCITGAPLSIEFVCWACIVNRKFTGFRIFIYILTTMHP